MKLYQFMFIMSALSAIVSNTENNDPMMVAWGMAAPTFFELGIGIAVIEFLIWKNQ